MFDCHKGAIQMAGPFFLRRSIRRQKRCPRVDAFDTPKTPESFNREEEEFAPNRKWRQQTVGASYFVQREYKMCLERRGWKSKSAVVRKSFKCDWLPSCALFPFRALHSYCSMCADRPPPLVLLCNGLKWITLKWLIIIEKRLIGCVRWHDSLSHIID